MKILSLLLVLLLSFDIAAQVKYIEKDTPAPYSGFLFTPEKTKSVRKELIEKDKLTIFNKALRKSLQIQVKVINNQKEQVNILKEQNTKLVKEIDRERSVSNFERSVWFILGVTVTGFAVYGAKQIVQ